MEINAHKSCCAAHNWHTKSAAHIGNSGVTRSNSLIRANQRPPDGEVLEVTHLLRQMNRDCQAALMSHASPKLD